MVQLNPFSFDLDIKIKEIVLQIVLLNI
jgi:hypothetical protein